MTMVPESKLTGRSRLLMTLAILLTVMICLPTVGLGESQKLLLLNSYTPGYKWTDDIIRGVTDAVRRQHGGIYVSIHQQFMDAKLASDPEYFRLLYQSYRHKFRNNRFDAIIAADNDAFDFLLEYRDDLFPNTPIIFCGVNDFQPAQIEGHGLITGVNELADFKATLDLALKLHPKTRQIVVINDTTTTGRAVHKKITELIPLYRDRIDFVLLETDVPQILETVQKLREGSLVFYMFFFRDAQGRAYPFDDVISRISPLSQVPIYGAWDFNLGYGIVGGMLTSGYRQGESAGKLAMRVLGGEDIQNIPVDMQSTNAYMFDDRELRRFGIRHSDLPAGSMVINRPGQRYTVNRPTILSAMGAVIGLLIIILLMLRNISMKKRGEAKLRQLADELEMRIKERTAQLEESQAALEEQHRILQETYNGLQVETSDRIRVMEELRIKDQLLINQSRMAAVGEMLGNIAHQWRQPLNVLGLTIQELGLSYRMGQFNQELLESNIAKAMQILQQISRTIDDFRIFSSPDQEKVVFRVNYIVEKTLSLIGDSFSELGIRLETGSDGEPEIKGYPNEYAQVLLNILLNARDAFLERRIEEPKITLRSWTENGRAELTVTDNAGGIDEEIMHKIFDPYFTTKDPGRGTGVGLFMSRNMIEKNMGGHITVRNTGNGAEFRITV